jgi:hypothetical protein
MSKKSLNNHKNSSCISLTKYDGFIIQRILSLEQQYYRWRVYSYLQGDGDKKYRIEDFQILRGGSVWYPPQNPNQYSYPSILNSKQIKYFTENLLLM